MLGREWRDFFTIADSWGQKYDRPSVFASCVCDGLSKVPRADVIL